MSRQFSMVCVILALTLAMCLGTLSGCGRPQQRKSAPSAPQPAPATPRPPAGTIRQVGSTTLLPLAERWRVEYNKINPSVSIAVSGGGSGAGLKALIGRTAEIADSSRGIKPEEVRQAEAAGVKPVEHRVAYDGIAVVVNPACLLTQISVEKLSDLYTGKIRTWDELGAKGLGAVQLVSRDTTSGTYEVFKELVVTLNGKDKSRNYIAGALNKTSNQAVLATVAQSKAAIGYVGLGYVDDSVKVLKVIPVGGKEAVAPNAETVLAKKYPLWRPLYCYTNDEPTGNLKAYLDYIRSDKGQAMVTELGFVPLKAAAVKPAAMK